MGPGMIKYTSHTLLLLMIGAACLACEEPGVIAPLPSPIAPDNDKIISSSLTVDPAAEKPQDRPVAVVGLEGAVVEAGQVEITNARTGAVANYDTTDAGSFSAVALGQPGDELELIYVDLDGGRSESTRVTIGVILPQRDDALQGAGEPPEGPPDFSAIPGDENETDVGAGGGTPCPEGETDCDGYEEGNGETDPNTPSAGTDGDDAGKTTLAATTSLENGELRIMAGPGFTAPGSIVVFANHTSGAAHATTADSAGGLTIIFPAEVGDEIHMIGQNPTTGETNAFVQFIVQ